jgi:hypothetical protein
MTHARRIVTIASLLLAVLGLDAAVAEAKCPPGLKKRTPDQVVADQRAALAAQDWEALACNYALKPYMFTDQGVLIGVEEIVGWFQSLAALFQGAPRLVHDDIFFKDTAWELYRLDAGWVVIPDGVDTYRIRAGKIHFQTTHGVIEFTGPPPD